MTMSKSQQRAAEILHDKEKGPEIYLQLVSYSKMLARMHGWRVGVTLPEGNSPESIAHEVVLKVLTGVRIWDESKEPSIINALKGMVKSEIWHLYEKLEESLLESTNTPLPDGKERTDDSFSTTKLHPDELSPEGQVLANERARLEYAAMTLLLREVEGNADLELVALALCDTDSPAEISVRTGLTIQRVYTARRELKRIARKILPARVAREAREEKKL
jgi:hypothetical protein